MTGSTRRPFEDVIAGELSRLLRRELIAGMRGVFEDLRDAGQGSAAPINVVINNNAGASVSARTTEGPFNQKQLEITIDQMVAQSLVQGRQTSGVLRALFGLAPGLSGR